MQLSRSFVLACAQNWNPEEPCCSGKGAATFKYQMHFFFILPVRIIFLLSGCQLTWVILTTLNFAEATIVLFYLCCFLCVLIIILR